MFFANLALRFLIIILSVPNFLSHELQFAKEAGLGYFQNKPIFVFIILTIGIIEHI